MGREASRARGLDEVFAGVLQEVPREVNRQLSHQLQRLFFGDPRSSSELLFLRSPGRRYRRYPNPCRGTEHVTDQAKRAPVLPAT